MNLTSEQIEAAKQGGVVHLALPGAKLVVIREDIYDRLKALVYDDSEWTPDEMQALAEFTFDDADDAGPIA